MRTYAMTGGATGIGAAVKKMLEESGGHVINVDIQESDIVADLSKHKEREKAVEKIREAAPDGLDGFIPSAGLGPAVPDWPVIISVNYFAAKVLTESLKDLLMKKKGAVVLISSNSAPLPGLDENLINAILEDNDEDKSHDLIKSLDGHNAYAGSKLALTRWMRQIAPDWIADGVRVNAVAPGATMTPLLQQGLDDPGYGPLIRDFTVPTGDFGTPEQIASAIMFLLSEQASFCCGSVFFVDGGTDALMRPDQF